MPSNQHFGFVVCFIFIAASSRLRTTCSVPQVTHAKISIHALRKIIDSNQPVIIRGQAIDNCVHADRSGSLCSWLNDWSLSAAQNRFGQLPVLHSSSRGDKLAAYLYAFSSVANVTPSATSCDTIGGQVQSVADFMAGARGVVIDFPDFLLQNSGPTLQLLLAHLPPSPLNRNKNGFRNEVGCNTSGVCSSFPSPILFNELCQNSGYCSHTPIQVNIGHAGSGVPPHSHGRKDAVCRGVIIVPEPAEGFQMPVYFLMF